MRKFAITTIATCALLLGGLTGCGTDNQSGDMGAGTFRGAGTTGTYPLTEKGTTGATYTGEGPITDMFTTDDRIRQNANEHRTLERGTLNRNRMNVQNRQANQNVDGLPGTPSSRNDRIISQNRLGDGRDIVNNNGEEINTERIEKIVQQMIGVNDAYVVAQGNTVIIGVDTNDNNRNNIENKIKQRVKKYTENRDVYVVTDKEQLGRIRTMGEQIRKGGTDAMREVGQTFNEMVNDLARAAKRPFERSR